MLRCINATLCSLALLSCAASKPVKEASQPKMAFNFLNKLETFQLTVTQVHKRNGLNVGGSISYDLLIGTPISSMLPRTISVLTTVDTLSYKVGDTIKITPQANAFNLSARLVYLVKDTVINHHKQFAIIGAEYPALWGNISR